LFTVWIMNRLKFNYYEPFAYSVRDVLILQIFFYFFLSIKALSFVLFVLARDKELDFIF